MNRVAPARREVNRNARLDQSEEESGHLVLKRLIESACASDGAVEIDNDRSERRRLQRVNVPLICGLDSVFFALQ